MQILVVFGIIISLILWECEARSTGYDNRQTSRKQKKLVEGSMDLNEDPCEDFYKYSCGNWHQVHTEGGSNYYEPITLLDFSVNQEMSRVFNRFITRDKPRFLKQAYFYYKSCKNLDKYESINYLKWLKINDRFRWPALWTQIEKTAQFDWVQTLAKMRTYGFNEVFIQQIVMSKINYVNQFIIDLDKPVTNGGFKPLTKQYFAVLMESLPAHIKSQDFEKLWQELEEFEEKLLELDSIEDAEVDTAEDYEKKRLFRSSNLPLDWLKDYVNIILNQTHLKNDMEFYIQNVPYMKALDKLLKQYSQRFLCKYLEIRFLWHLHTSGPLNFQDVDCLASARSLMPTAMHWQYEQHHLPLLQEYSKIYDIFNDMRKHFNNSVIKNRHGFNASVVEYLQNKIKRMKLRLNNVPRIDTANTLEKFYEQLNLNSHQFYENHLKLLQFNFQARLRLLSFSEPPILDYTYLENSETGSSSSPYFVQNANTVFVPLTLLQLPIYSAGLDNIYKYSSLGFLLAHEMFHGFDDSGLLIDANGNLTLMEFEENPLFNASLNCLMELNPQVISEKIADVSGLRFAYQAFFDSHAEAVNQSVFLHGQEMSAKKLFFLNFAQFFCGDFSDAAVALNEHGSDRERVMDALSHFPEFSKEFKCNANHRLYPHESCHLWR